jgi:rod shape-determining protein MreC
LDLARKLDEARDETQRLKSWEWRAQELERKLQEMSRLMNTVRDTSIPFVTVRVVANSSGAFVRSAIVNGGKEQNIRPGYPVMGADGLAGRIVDTGERAARILLLTDLNSRIPVHIGKNGARAVLTGDNGPLPRLAYLAADAGVAPGDEVSTSGIGGLFPRGLRIGVVVDGGRVLRVQPYANLDSLEFLSVLFYESPALGITDDLRSGPGTVLSQQKSAPGRDVRADGQ